MREYAARWWTQRLQCTGIISQKKLTKYDVKGSMKLLSETLHIYFNKKTIVLIDDYVACGIRKVFH